jgi:SH3-like domain-containing protein
MQQPFSKQAHRIAAAMLLSCALTGCSHLQRKPSTKYIYVSAKQTFLRDRVAAVSNRTGTASNGEQLLVLERTRRWVRVQTPRNEVGWIEDRPSITVPQQVEDGFESLRSGHANDPIVSTATTSDEAYLHVSPGRETDHLYLLPEGSTLNLLARASVPKPIAAGAAPPPSADNTAPPPPPLEDWWLVRDAKGQTGWIYSRLLEVAAPDTLLRYAEGQRIVAAYILSHVDDPDSGILDNGTAITSIPQYLTVLSPYKSGLPYDFNQVRVFIWNTKKHRYETSFSERNIVGYLPLKITQSTDPYEKGPEAAEKLPTFTYRVLAADQPIPQPNPTTGLLKPGPTIQKTYRLEGNICRRLIAPGTPPPAEAHAEEEAVKKEKIAKRRRK